ncbi:FAD/NAD(P)-binding domain-containing protein, partial [Periconia macrospinosa]
MHPILLESSPTRRAQHGDIISFGANSSRIFRSWGSGRTSVEQKLDPICHHSTGLEFRTFDDEVLVTQVWGDEEGGWGKRFNGHRGEIHGVVWDYAVEVGVEIRLGSKVVEYFEDEDGAGVVVLENSSSGGEEGEERVVRLRGDVVIAADGVRSKARSCVLGVEDRPVSSGYAVYRAWMDDTDKLREDPRTAWLVADPNVDQHVGWLGPDVHFLVATLQRGTKCSWVLTHKDDADILESYSERGTVEGALGAIPGWSEVCHAIIRATPEESLVDWKLVFREPLPTWISGKGRIALIGDAAHPFLPTSIQGASQAMEDGVTIAVCLERAFAKVGGGEGVKPGKNVPEALAAFQKIRYDRVLAIQRTGITNRDQWHKADFDEVRKNPEIVKLPRHEWILNFDAQQHAYDVYDETVKELEK